MIPANDDMPSAADQHIMQRTEAALIQHRDVVAGAVTDLLSLVQQTGHQSLAELDDEARQEVVTNFKGANPAFIAIFQTCVVASYYQDDRVLRGLGLPDRAPFPLGNAVDETNWTLLDPVRERSPFYRVVDGEAG